ncbi:hypothetical protein P9199_17355 [Geobacillus stearothermophilus]|uniref:hypothetical protein n=1 Tax=Geobacillus stearothermophilus TaxID=1422 RepID=UPI002E1BF912|nr:hypothetical protein [Geobacillus stearothermophilus]
MIFNQPVNKYYYGIMLFYPYLAPILKYFSLVPISSFYPPLWDNVGLNVSTYITDAYQDFGFFGMYIYLFLLFLFLRTGQKTLLNGVYGLLCYISVVNIAFWMVFDNAFRSGPFLISFFLFYFITVDEHFSLQ